MQVSMEMIGPTEAAEILKGNWGNRKLEKVDIFNIANDMKAGRWMPSHQGIAISSTGRLLDGQHRLHAIIAAGVRVPIMVTRGLSDEVFRVTDIGRKRTLGDVMRMDRRLLEPCNWIARLHGADRVKPHHVDAIMPRCGPHLEALIATAGAAARGRTAAPVKSAACLRMIQGHGDYVLPQWAALVHLNYGDMSPAMQAFCKQITDERLASRRTGGNQQTDRAARAWIAFDPSKAGVVRIQVSDIDVIMSQMRAVFAPWDAA